MGTKRSLHFRQEYHRTRFVVLGSGRVVGRGRGGGGGGWGRGVGRGVIFMRVRFAGLDEVGARVLLTVTAMSWNTACGIRWSFLSACSAVAVYGIGGSGGGRGRGGAEGRKGLLR